MGLLPVVTATASTVYSASFLADKAIDRTVSITNRWAATTGVPQWLMLDLGASQIADYYCLAPGTYVTPQDPVDWTLEGSNDTSTWTTLSTITGWSFSNEANTFSFSNSTAYRYYRIHITATGGDVASLSEFRVGITDPSPTAITASTVTTINNASSGIVTISMAPAAGQVVIVSAACNRSDLTISGLGATWTMISNSMASSWSSTRHAVWVGVGATSSGNITISAGGLFYAQVLALTATNCDGTNIKALPNGVPTTAYPGQIILSAVYEGSANAPSLGGATTPSSAAWTTTSGFATASGHRIRHAYRVAGRDTSNVEWTGLSSAGSNTVVLGFALPSPVTAQVGSVFIESMISGMPGVQIESVHTQALVTGSMTAQIESVFVETMTEVRPVEVSTVYAEALLSTTPAVQVESQYLEILLLPTGAKPFRGWGVPI